MIPNKEEYGLVYFRCVENKRPNIVRDRMKGILPEVARIYEEYIEKARRLELFSFPKPETISSLNHDVSVDEIHDLYDSAMVRKKGGGRADYDRIKTGAAFGICLYCGQLAVKTLDHFLPRSKWKSLSVCQVNLVPACRDCNAEKMDCSPISASDTFFHPYFDDMNAFLWLAAKVVEVDPVRMEFFVECEAEDRVFAARALRHFEGLKLKVLYEAQAVTEVASLTAALTRIHSVDGAKGVQKELSVRADDNSELSANSWRAAMYRAAASSEWFCDLKWIKIS